MCIRDRSQAIHWLNLGPEKAIKQARVDSITIQGSQKLFKKVRAMGELRHKDLQWDTPFSKYKWWPSESEKLVFEVEDIPKDSPHLIGMGVFDPTVKGHRPELPDSWHDLTLEEAQAWCLAGKSCYFAGAPRYG